MFLPPGPTGPDPEIGDAEHGRIGGIGVVPLLEVVEQPPPDGPIHPWILHDLFQRIRQHVRRERRIQLVPDQLHQERKEVERAQDRRTIAMPQFLPDRPTRLARALP